MKNNNFTRMMAIILAVLMAASVLVGAISSLRASADSIDTLKKRQTELAQKKKDLKAKIESAEYEQSSVMAKKKLLDEQISLTEEEIEYTVQLIDEYTAFIAQCEIDIVETQKKEEEQWEAYKKRVRAMEENGDISYYEVLLTATSFPELLSRMDSVSEIMERDRNLYNELVDTRNELIRLKEEKENAVVEQEAKKEELILKQADLEKQIEDASRLIQQYQNSIDIYKANIDEIEAENSRIEKEIKAAANAKPSNTGGNSGNGGTVKGEGSFIWPSQASTYVTSRFGYRSSPTAGASTYHKGIDIGASYGTNILAAKSGTVSVSALSSSYGNYVVINHGDGTTTTYAHMSKRLVSAGQTVKQGEVIGLVGSTGISTGPHLHFEVTVNGSRVNPLNYFSNYTMSPRA